MIAPTRPNQTAAIGTLESSSDHVGNGGSASRGPPSEA
jgi:hypothetical protein